MKAFFSMLVLVILNLGCSEDPRIENFKMQINPSQPAIIFSNITERDVIGVEIVEQEITGPWMQIGFDVVNDNTQTITISAAEFRVTAQDGATRVAETFLNFSDPPGYFGVFRAEGDINCDGVVDVLDATATNPASCVLDDQNPSFQRERWYVFNLLQGIEGERIDPFRGSSFDFEVRLEGWFGGLDDPQEGFFKIINFTVNSNGG